MRDVVICEPRRTAVGGFGGAFKATPVHELGTAVVRDILARTKLNPELVEDVLFANCYPTMDAPALGRVARFEAGRGDEEPDRDLRARLPARGRGCGRRGRLERHPLIRVHDLELK